MAKRIQVSDQLQFADELVEISKRGNTSDTIGREIERNHGIAREQATLVKGLNQ